MKKLITVLLAGMMILTLAAGASAYFEAEEAFGEVKFSIGKQTAAWNADGTISDGEYYKVSLSPAWLSYAINDTDTDAGLAYAKATTPELYMSWDENYVYTATRYEVTEGHENLWDGDPASMWYSGAVQFNYANLEEVASEYRLEYGVGLSSDTGDLLYTVWADGCGSGYEPTAEDAKVFLDGNTLTYETRCPWDAFVDESNSGYEQGKGFNFCLVWSIGKGQDYVHIQLAEGCTGNGKHAENMAQVKLGPAPASAVQVLHGTPEVDGKLDDAYLKSGSLDLENPGFYVWDGSEDFDMTATVYYLWDESNLYVCSVVKDNDVLDVGEERYEDNPINWQADAVENWFNEGLGKWKTHADAYGHTFFARNDGGECGDPPFESEDVKHAAAITDDGYIVEYALPLPEMGEGKTVSTSVQVNDQCSLDDLFGTGYASGSQNADHPLVMVAEEAAPSYTYPASGAEGTLISGSLIGNETGWDGTEASGRASAFDGNPATFFDPLGVGDGFIGIDAGESYLLDKVVILSRDGWNDRFDGAKIQGSNDGENWETLWTSETVGTYPDYYTVTEFENNTGYSQFRYFNDKNHGDVAEVEFYGAPGKVEPAPGFATADEAVASIGKAAIAGYEFTVGSEGAFGGEGPENLWDGDTNTKLCTNTLPASSAAKLDGTYAIDGIVIALANDNAQYGRIPTAWTLSGSNDGENWTEITSGDDTLFVKENGDYRYFAKSFDAAPAYGYVKIDITGSTDEIVQISEVVLTGEKAEAPAAVDEKLDQKANPNTFDFGVIAAVASVVSLCGFAVSKKKH